MKKITNLAQRDAMSFIPLIIDSRRPGDRKNRLICNQNLLIDLCNNYEYKKYYLESLTAHAFLPECREDFIDCYKSKTTSGTFLKSKILSLSSNCVYCNFNRTDSIDHYLPKEKFPEYSFYGINLFPCCTSCNQKKLDKWLGSDTKRMFLNSYFDEIPTEKFLFAHLSISHGLLICSFTISRENLHVTDELWILIESHFSNLNLTSRYKEDFESLVTELKNVVSENGTSLEDLKKFILNIRSSFVHLGKNYWKTVIYDEIISNNTYLEYFTS